MVVGADMNSFSEILGVLTKLLFQLSPLCTSVLHTNLVSISLSLPLKPNKQQPALDEEDDIAEIIYLFGSQLVIIPRLNYAFFFNTHLMVSPINKVTVNHLKKEGDSC